ncbi:MAG TPA: hypothetical protein PKY96_16790 [Flavobacteriales bacterium]|nr:hypothetical protein [Flavobacteriales bacterium]
MRYLRKLIPTFLWQWDQRLLQDWPRIWATRVHLHLWFLLLCNALAVVLGLLIHVSHRKFPNPEELYAYMMVPTIAYAAFWVYRAVRFNAEKRFGARKAYSEVGEFVVLWISSLLIMTIPTTLALTVGLRIAALTTDEEFVDEVDQLGGQLGWFYRGSSYYDPYYDSDYGYAGDDDVQEIEVALRTVQAEVDAMRPKPAERVAQGAGSHRFFRSLQEYRTRTESEDRVLHDLHDEYSSWIQRGNNALDTNDSIGYDPDTAAYYFAKADSVERACPLLLVEFDDLRPWSEKLRFKPDSVLEQEYLVRFTQGEPMHAEPIERALAIANKYSKRARLIGAAQVADEFERRVPSTTNIDACVQQLSRIAKAKDLRYFFVKEPGYFTFIAIFSFSLALLLVAFKRIYWQPFLIAIVTGAVVPIIVLIAALILEHDVIPLSEERIMIYAHWLIAVFLFAMLFSIGSLRAYRTNRAVMVLLANVIVPFFAVFTLFILHEEFDVFGEDALSYTIESISVSNVEDPRLPALHEQATVLRAFINRMMLGTLWGGIALYVLALHPLFTRLYARLMALPERS